MRHPRGALNVTVLAFDFTSWQVMQASFLWFVCENGRGGAPGGTGSRGGGSSTVTAHTVGGIHPRGMRRVTCLASRRHLAVGGSLVEVDLLPVRVASGVGAAL